jgi:hypothetical protein
MAPSRVLVADSISDQGRSRPFCSSGSAKRWEDEEEGKQGVGERSGYVWSLCVPDTAW